MSLNFPRGTARHCCSPGQIPFLCSRLLSVVPNTTILMDSHCSREPKVETEIESAGTNTAAQSWTPECHPTMYHQSDWDLVTRPKVTSLQDIEDEFAKIMKWSISQLNVVEANKSFLLHNPEQNTFGSMINASIGNSTGKPNGPTAVSQGGNNTSRPPNWIETILAFKAGVFKKLPDRKLPSYYEGKMYPYKVTITRAEYNVIETVQNCEFPSRDDWERETKETQARFDDIVRYKTRCEPDL